VRKSGLYTELKMEAEQINALGAQLADLAARTQDLRRYL
jgi:hypothetical protein